MSKILIEGVEPDAQGTPSDTVEYMTVSVLGQVLVNWLIDWLGVLLRHCIRSRSIM